MRVPANDALIIPKWQLDELKRALVNLCEEASEIHHTMEEILREIKKSNRRLSRAMNAGDPGR